MACLGVWGPGGQNQSGEGALGRVQTLVMDANEPGPNLGASKALESEEAGRWPECHLLQWLWKDVLERAQGSFENTAGSFRC